MLLDDFTTKLCVRCDKSKTISDFYRYKKTGRSYKLCKSCEKEKANAYQKTKEGVAAVIYNSQKQSSIKRGHKLPDYSWQGLLSWMNKQLNFDAIYLNWLNSGYSKDKKPSCDRINDYFPYTLDNIRLCTWAENNEKGSYNLRNGINNKINKAVVQLDMRGNFISRHHSISKASRSIDKPNTNIVKCLKGKIKHAYGYIWKYEDEFTYIQRQYVEIA